MLGLLSVSLTACTPERSAPWNDTCHAAATQSRPAEPDEPVGSSTKSAQLPISCGPEMLGSGDTGESGAATVMFCAVPSKQEKTFSGQGAAITPALRPSTAPGTSWEACITTTDAESQVHMPVSTAVSTLPAVAAQALKRFEQSSCPTPPSAPKSLCADKVMTTRRPSLEMTALCISGAGGPFAPGTLSTVRGMEALPQRSSTAPVSLTVVVLAVTMKQPSRALIRNGPDSTPEPAGMLSTAGKKDTVRGL